MLALKINDIKTFMNLLLIGNVFDDFPMTETSVTTFNTFTIDGRINRDFFDTDTQEILARNKTVHSDWKETKPFCRSIIRGKLLPLHMKIVFELRPEDLSLITDGGSEDHPDYGSEIRGFFLNIQYKNRTLLCTTGIAQSSFSMDKRPEEFWDTAVLRFFRRLGIDHEPL